MMPLLKPEKTIFKAKAFNLEFIFKDTKGEIKEIRLPKLAKQEKEPTF